MCQGLSHVTFFVQLIAEDTVVVPQFNELGHDELIVLGVSLQGQDPTWEIQALNIAVLVGTEGFEPQWNRSDNIAVHLMQFLRGESAKVA